MSGLLELLLPTIFSIHVSGGNPDFLQGQQVLLIAEPFFSASRIIYISFVDFFPNCQTSASYEKFNQFSHLTFDFHSLTTSPSYF